MSDKPNLLPDGGVIVDLSAPERLNRLMAYDDIASTLTQHEESKLADFVWACFEMSHQKISKRYDAWLEADRAHDVYVPPDATRFREKAVIADTRAVADTVLTYVMSAITGRNPMFQLEGLDRTSRRSAAVMERLLHRDMRNTAGEARIAQMVLDSIRYGFAPTKITWSEDLKSNQVRNFDPRRAFPDPRINWGQWDLMQFIGFADFASFDALNQSGLYPRLRYQPELREAPSSTGSRFNANKWSRENSTGLSIDPKLVNAHNNTRTFALGKARAVNELWLRLTGADVNLPNIDEIWLIVTLLDESHVIRLQLNPYGRCYPTVIGGYYNDYHKSFSQSLYDVLMPLHNIATWLLRSRVDNVQAALNNLIFADPSQINITDLVDRNPWGIVRTLPGAKPGDGVFVASVPDVTRGHWNDIAAISDQKQRVSAASDAQQGMPTADVRTATEIQRMSQLGSQRLGTLSRIMSATTIRPMVRMMVANIQDSLQYEGSLKVDPYNTPGLLSSLVKDGYLDFSIEDLQGKIDYLVIDGTLPSEPSRDPSTWMNIIQLMNQTGLGMEYKLGLMAEEAIRATGIHDLDKFRITPEERGQGMTPSQKIQLMEKLRGANTLPTEDVLNEVGKGNLIPFNGAA